MNEDAPPRALPARLEHPAPRTALLALLLLLGGCATVPAPAPQPSAAIDAAAAGPTAEQAVAEALDEVLLAREQARLGLMDEADAAWVRAIALLQPHALRVPRIAEQLREVEAERERAIREAALRAEVDEEGDATEEAASTQILGVPEPPLDPTLLPQVSAAAQGVQADYPIVLNNQVLAWLEAWSGRLRGYFGGSIERSGMYRERFRQIFAEEGVPQDLVYLAHVESGFKTTAYSPAAARGIFQFIAETGRRYGLVINWWLDERADPEKSARASASYLRDLYAEFGDWYLALAAYNSGEGRVRNALAGSGGVRDFFHPAMQRFFPRETRNYVPAIIAATLVAKDPARFGLGEAQPLEPLVFESVVVPGPTSLDVLAEVAGISVDELRQYNPALRRHSTPPAYKDFVVKLPVGRAEGFAERLAQVPVDQRLRQKEHVVRKGETVASIARRHGVNSAAVINANALGRRPRLWAGQVLVIPDGPEAAAAASEERRREKRATAPGGVYTVRKGDHLSAVAGRFRVSVQELRRWNNLGPNAVLQVGQKLRVAEARAAAPSKRSAGGPEAKSAKGAPKGGTKSAAAKESTSRKGDAAKKSASRTHTVRSGETLWNIAARYNVSVQSISAANGLRKNTVLRSGQRLVIPAEG